MTVVDGVNSYRWFAPEVIFGDTLISTRSDVHSFAMTVLELMTDKPPFPDIKHASIPSMLKAGKRPEQPTDESVIIRGLDDKLWALLTRCWSQEPLERPDIYQVNKELESMWA